MTQASQSIFEQAKNEQDYFRKAQLLRSLHYDQKVTLDEISKYLNIKPSYICHLLRLNKIPELIVDGFYSKSITISHLFILSRLKDADSMINAYEMILSNNYTVLQTELLVREFLYGTKKSDKYLSRQKIKELTQGISTDNMNVKILQSRGKCIMQIEVRGSIDETSTTISKLIDCVRTVSRKLE